MVFLSTLLFSMFVTIVMIPVCRDIAIRLNVVDRPGDRKIHSKVVPRCGGVAMAIGALAPSLLWVPVDRFGLALLIGAAILLFIGVLDDLLELTFKSKFVAQCAAALIIIMWGGVKISNLGILLPGRILLPDVVAVPLTLIAIVGVTNAINLSDGLDGLAGGISMLSFAFIGYFAYRSGYVGIFLLSAAMIGSIFGFLRFNSYPATLFMGDAGSQLLGFLLITLSLKFTQNSSNMSPLLPLLIIAFPVLDTLTVMITRIIRGKSPFAADKNHFHHRLMGLGFTHTETVLIIYICHIVFLAFAFVFRIQNDWLILSVYLLVSVAILAGLSLAEHARWEFKRSGSIDKIISSRFKRLSESAIIIKISFKTIEIGIPLLLLFISFLPETYPVHISAGSVITSVLIVVTWFAGRRWVYSILGFSLYLFTPFLIYIGETQRASWCHSGVLLAYNLSFGILLLAVILTLKLTRRRNGFKSSPMDFLILLFALVVPNLPDEFIRDLGMNFMLVKIIVFYFAFEVLAGELRIRNESVGHGRIGLSFLPILLVVCVRSFM